MTQANMGSIAIGTTRNLTYQFKRYRDEARRISPEGIDMDTASLLNTALGGGADSSDIEMSASPLLQPAWVQKSESIRLELRQLREQLIRLKEAHSKVLLVTFDSGNDAQTHAEALTRELQQGFKNVSHDINSINLMQGSDTEVRQQVKQQLARALMGLTMEFRKEETRFLNQMEAQKGLAEGSSIALLEQAEDPGGFEGGFSQAQSSMVDSMSATAAERDREIQKVVETITELAQIMRDLGTLVVEQGSILDRIDHNVTETAQQIEEGVEHLVQAEKKQKQGRMWMCIVALVVLIIVMVIIVAARFLL